MAKLQSIDSGNEGSVAALYVVQPTDTAERISERFAVPLERFLGANPEIGRVGRVLTGQIVQIPLTPPVLPNYTRVATEYVVQVGDTLFSIAKQFGVGMPALQKTNPLVNPDRIFAGQMLLIPVSGDVQPTLPALLYVTQPGDTPSMVAGLFGFSVQALAKANPQRFNPDRLFAGEIIVLPVSGVPDAPIFDRVRYVVQPMDSIEEIVRQFEVWLYAVGSLNAAVAPIPGLILQLPVSIPVPAPLMVPDAIPAAHPAPFGQRLDLGDDDAAFLPFPRDFRITFYGQQSSDGLWVNSNGSVTIGEADPAFVPTTDGMIEGPPRIAPFWTDLVPTAAVGTGGVFTDFYFDPADDTRRLAITWDRVPIFGMDLFFTVQLIVSPNGDLAMYYFAVPALPKGEEPRILIGLAPGQNKPGSSVFLYNGTDNQRRAGNQTEPIPMGNLSGRVLLYRYDAELGSYTLNIA